MPGPVSFETMVAYVDQQVTRILSAVEHLAREQDRHQEYHRGLLEEQIRNQRSAGFSWAQTIINLVVVAVAVVSLVVTIVHVH